MHADQIERYGGSPGIRDPGILEAALFRPQTGYYADLIEEAAALWESLAQNHPFIDGNKRTAFAATYTFLAINGTRLTASADGIGRIHSAGLYTGNRSPMRHWFRGYAPIRRGITCPDLQTSTPGLAQELALPGERARHDGAQVVIARLPAELGAGCAAARATR